MYVLNFKKQFVPAIEARAKKQTIRAIRKDNRQPKVEDLLRLYTGMRTKGCRRIADVICTDVLPIKIYNDRVTLNNGQWEFATPSHLKNFAESDGFKSWEEMREFFKKNHGFPFNGILIRWKYFGEDEKDAL